MQPGTRDAIGTRAAVFGALLVAVLSLAACGGGDDATSGDDTLSTLPSGVAAADTTPSAPTTPAPNATDSTSAPDTTANSAPIDWANLTYDLGCGPAHQLPLVDGRFEPAEFNGTGGLLLVELRGAEPLPGDAGTTLVHLGCVAGGATGALSAELYAVMSAPAGAPTPVLLTVLTANPGAVHVVAEDGTVIVDDLVHGADDPNCCPSVFRSQQIIWEGATPVVIEGARPTAPSDGNVIDDGCVGTELSPTNNDPTSVMLLRNALTGAGYDAGPTDTAYDDALINAVVRYIEVNADNPALKNTSGSPYENLHAEALHHRTVRAPVIVSLGIACSDVRFVAPN